MRRFFGIAIYCAAIVATGASAGDRATDTDWLNRVADELRSVQYRVTWQNDSVLDEMGAAWHAVNRAHDLRAYFDGSGVRVVSRMEAEPSWTWGCGLGRIGRASLLQRPAEPRLQIAGRRIDYRRGAVSEWFVNSPSGLEHGMRLEQRLPGLGELVIEFDHSGSLSPRIREGSSIELVDEHHSVRLRQVEIAARDSAGRAVPLGLQGFSDGGRRGLRLRIDDRRADYPLELRAVTVGPGWSYLASTAGSGLGPVATAGDVNGDGFSDVVIGAPDFDNGQSGEGVVLLFFGSAAGPASTPDWSAEGQAPDAALGAAVFTAGDVNGDGYADLIVGSPGYAAGEPGEGRAVVFHGAPAGPAAGASWSAEIDVAGARFGASVSTAGDIDGDGYADVLIGADSYTNGQLGEGFAALYRGSATGLSILPAWSQEGEAADAAYGSAVSLAGDVDGDGFGDVLIGAPGLDASRGRAFVYRGSAAGLSVAADWTTDGGAPGDALGAALATGGDVNGDGYADLIVGAPGFGNGEPGEGAAYAFIGSSTGPAGTATWTVEGGTAGAGLGGAVSTAGDVDGDGYADVAIGAEWLTHGTGRGRVQVFRGSPGGLAGVAWATLDGGPDGRLGHAVATAGDVDGDGFSDLLAGDPASGIGGEAVLLFGHAAGPLTTAGWTAEGNQVSANYGHSIAAAGDVNGDGFGDVIVGSDFFDNGEVDEGMAFVFHGSASGLATTPSWQDEGDQTGANFGHVVSSAGDVNGDGYDDVLVSAYFFDNGHTDEGRAYLYYGSPSGVELEPAWTDESDQAGAFFGSRLSRAGDVNGDGYGDVIVGALRFDGSLPDEGAAFVYHGSASGLSVDPDWTAFGQSAGALFGVDVSAAGDVNGDGFSDVAVGSLFFTVDDLDEGAAFVFHGSSQGLSTAPDWIGHGDQPSALFGHSVAAADVNDDGFSDLVLGSLWYSNGESNEGAAFAYHGSPSGLSTVPDWSVESDQADAEFGFPVAPAGDVNGDGYGDVLIGGYLYDNGEQDEGSAFLYLGSATGLSPQADWITESDQAFTEYGIIVDTAGDVNGDGFADMVVGGHGFTNGENQEGRAFLFYGNAGVGRGPNARVRQADDSTPLPRLGRTTAPDAIRLVADGYTPFGRGRVKLEWEVKPLGVAFDGSGLQRSAAWSDSGTGGVTLSETATGLTPGTPQRWRARVLYEAASLPLQPAGRWQTPPIDGPQETDLRTRPLIPAGSVPDGRVDPAMALRIEPAPTGGELRLNWGFSCAASDTDYAVYAGTLGDFDSHVQVSCSTLGATTLDVPEGAGSRYFLVVPQGVEAEGGYGNGLAGAPRQPAALACRPSAPSACTPF